MLQKLTQQTTFIPQQQLADASAVFDPTALQQVQISNVNNERIGYMMSQCGIVLFSELGVRRRAGVGGGSGRCAAAVGQRRRRQRAGVVEWRRSCVRMRAAT